MSKPPTVSVLMSVYNGEKYLRQAMDSVLSQSFTDFEFIIVDDGSTDQSLPILLEYSRQDPRVRLSSRPNRGLTKTLNEGLKLCAGEFVARMDSDDICLPDRFAKQVGYLREHPELLLIGGQVQFIDPDGAPINLMPGLFLTHDEIDAALLRKGWPVVHPAVMMRTAAVLAINGYSEAWLTNQDHDLFIRLCEIGKMANLPDVVLKYRQHFESISLGKSRQQGDTVEAIVRQAYMRRLIETPAALLNSRPKVRTKLDYHRYWCWAALSGGNVHTARKHAIATFTRVPFSPESWRMVYCALRGR